MTSSNDESESNTSYCTSCGEEISNEVKFCPECGANQDIEQGTENEQTIEEEQATATTTVDSTDTSSDGKSGLRHKLPGVSKNNTTRRNVLFGAGYTVLGLFAIGAAAGPEENTSGGDGGTSGGDGGTSGGDGGTSGGDGGGESYPNAYYYDEDTGIVLEDDVSAEANSIGALYIRGTARNESGQSYSYVQITFSVLDSSGAKVADALANTNELSDGQAWRYEALAASAENADSYQIQDITAY